MDIVRSEHDLPTLRVRLGVERAGQPVAVFEVLLGGLPAVEVTRRPTEALGLPSWLRSSHDVTEERLGLDPQLVSSVAQALTDLAPASPAYWLELASPRGYLHLLPWERFLSPALGRPLLRLPNFTLRPQAPGHSLRVALVVAQVATLQSFDADALAATVIGAWNESLDREVSVDVFAGPGTVDGLQERLGPLPRVVVHRPPSDARTTLTDRADSVWLRWVGAELANAAPDVGHLVGHGTLSGERGGFRLPPLGARTDTAGVARAQDIVAALQRTGAWSLVVTAAPGNHCLPGLRDLVDGVAQMMPGVIALHRARDEHDDSLAPALRMIYGGQAPMGPLPELMCWVHPQFVEFPRQASRLCHDDGTSVLIQDSTQRVLAEARTPAWVAAGVRALESLQAQLDTRGEAPPDSRTLAALETVSAIFGEHVRAFASETDQQQSPTSRRADEGGAWA